MLRRVNLLTVLLIAITLCCVVNCRENMVAKEKEIVKVPEEMDDQVSDNLKATLLFAKDHNGKINDSTQLLRFNLVGSFYQKNDYRSIWSSKENWIPLADSMYSFIENSKYYGLYPQDYHCQELKTLREQIRKDTLVRMDAIAWTRLDLLLSDAFMQTLKDLKEGRLLADSNSITSQPKFIDSFFIHNLSEMPVKGSLSVLFNSQEPANYDYQSLRQELKNFVDSMDTKTYLYIKFPFKDSLNFIKDVNKRLSQSGFSDSSIRIPDSATFIKAVKKYQAKHHLTIDGKPGAQLVRTLNSNDRQKFKQIAITLDRYKLFPAFPQSYIWVNLPGQYLKVWDHDTVVLESKVVIGKPTTPTPVLFSEISDMVTYPQWTIPESIIRKDILPALKIDPGYLARKGFNLVDSKGETVDPYTVNWTKYSKGIPWKIMQGSGDDNALGIFKFNFNNPYSVYLHDTNQRYLFQNSKRALSHGCVRVQNWEGLAYFIARYDSMALEKGQSIPYTIDSIKTWIANKSRKRIIVKKRLPLFIGYFTCEAKNHKIVFYDDIYNKDQFLAEKYFAGK